MEGENANDKTHNREVEEPPSNTQNDAGDGQRLTLQTVLAFIGLASQFNAYIMSLLIPSTTLSYINEELGPDPNHPWITISWTLCASIIISVAGRLADIFGRRYFMLFGSLLAFIGTIVGATGQSINQMIASGVIFGIASGFQEMSYACIQEIVPNKWRIYAIAVFVVDLSVLSGCFELLATISFTSPLVAYVFIAKTSVGWRGAYWYMCAFHGFFFVYLVFTYFPPTFDTKHKYDGKTKLQLLQELDYVGLLLFSAGCLLFLLGINYGGQQYPWEDGHVIGPMVVGLLCLVALGFWEAYADLKYPLMPPRMFKRVRRFTMVLVVCFVGGMLYYSMNVLWPLQSQQLFTGPDPIIRGVYANLIPFGTLIAAIIVLVFCSWFGRERWQLVGFTAIQVALIGSLGSVGVDDKAQATATVIFLSATVSPPQLISFTMLSLAIDDQTDIGIAVGLAGTFRLLGGAVATAVYSAIVNNTFAGSLPGHIGDQIQGLGFPTADIPALLEAAVTNTASAYAAVPNISEAVTSAAQFAVQLAYAEAFRVTYLSAIAFGGLAVIASAFTRSIDKSTKNMAKAVQLENDTDKDKPDEKLQPV